MDKLYLRPESSDYAVGPSNAFLQTKLDGGASRFRKDRTGNARLVEVSWLCDREQYDYLESFFDTTIDEGSLPFLIDLIIEKSELKEYTAHFIPDSKQLDGIQGFAYSVSAQLEVLPTPIDNEANAIIVETFELVNVFGVNIDFANCLNRLVNFDLDTNDEQ